MTELARVARAWWPPPLFVAIAMVGQRTLLGSRYDVGGHAAEHLGSASIPFVGAAWLAILLWATPRAYRQADVLICMVGWFTATVVVMIGNLRVVDDLIAAGYAQTPTSAVPDVTDHALANSSIWYGVAAALLLVTSLRRRQHLGNRATMGAVLATIVVPPWIFPGMGVVVVTIVRCVARHRERSHALRAAGTPLLRSAT